MLQQRQPTQYQQLQQSGGIDNGNPLVAPLRQLQDERQKGTLMCLINNQVMQSASPQTKATSTPTSNFAPLSAVETESAGSWYNVNRTTAADFALSQAERAITSGTSSSPDKLDATAHHAEKKRSPPKKRQPSFPSVSIVEDAKSACSLAEELQPSHDNLVNILSRSFQSDDFNVAALGKEILGSVIERQKEKICWFAIGCSFGLLLPYLTK
eukprot:scaffold1954_cov146-Alexandrium_tamarense.AAC.6